MLSLFEFFAIFGVSACCAGVAYALVVYSMARSEEQTDAEVEPMAFLFDDGILHHASHKALTTFALSPGTHVWDDLRESLIARFPQLPETVNNTSIGNMAILPDAEDDQGLVTLHWRDNLCWVELFETTEDKGEEGASAKDYAIIKYAAETSPHPAWETLPYGGIGWRNPAYDQLVAACGHNNDDVIFETPSEDEVVQIPLKLSSQRSEWYELTSTRVGEAMMHHATCVTDQVKAETRKRTFVQTLAKTFAQLPIGLAIFDRNDQLFIFNPALVDLSDLEPQYLAGRPTMLSFFDALRENRQMPEPKNYNAWRKQIAAMVTAAADGNYNETWALEDGRTYTVQGRPHPDGATAFLIEDISAEVTLSRNFRSEVKQYEALLNTVDDAMIVFSSGGIVTFSNEAYQNMWGQNPEVAFADVTIQDAIDLWQENSQADWAEISDFVKTLSQKDESTLKISSQSFGEVDVQLSQIGSGSTLVRFSLSATHPKQQPKQELNASR